MALQSVGSVHHGLVLPLPPFPELLPLAPELGSATHVPSLLQA